MAFSVRLGLDFPRKTCYSRLDNIQLSKVHLSILKNGFIGIIFLEN
jgi:hypothetical protein